MRTRTGIAAITAVLTALTAAVAAPATAAGRGSAGPGSLALRVVHAGLVTALVAYDAVEVRR